MWKERQMFANLRNITTKRLSKTSSFTYRPCRLTYWWTRFITLPFTRTWQVIWHFFIQTHRLILCQSAELSDTLLFSNCTAQGNHKPTDRVNELADKCRYFWKSLKGECTVNCRHQIHVLTKWLPSAEPTANLVSCFMRGCPSTT